jgi:serine/threonine protein kinase
MAPEQVQGKESTAQVDIYALGIIAYELATGELPYTADDWYKLASQIISEPLPKLDAGRFGIPNWFEQFINKATAKLPSERYNSAREIIEIFEDGLSQAETVKLKGRTRRRQPSEAMVVAQSAMLNGLYYFAPLIVIICVLAIIAIAAISSSERSVTNVSSTMNQGNKFLQQFANTLERLNRVVVQTHQNSGKIDTLLTDLEKSSTTNTATPELKSKTEAALPTLENEPKTQK